MFEFDRLLEQILAELQEQTKLLRSIEAELHPKYAKPVAIKFRGTPHERTSSNPAHQ